MRFTPNKIIRAKALTHQECCPALDLMDFIKDLNNFIKISKIL